MAAGLPPRGAAALSPLPHGVCWPMPARLILTRGDGRTLHLWAYDRDTGARLTLTGARIRLTARTSYDTGAVVFEKATATEATVAGDAALTGIAVDTDTDPATAAEPWHHGDFAVVTIAPADTTQLPAMNAPRTLVWDAKLGLADDDGPLPPVTPAGWRGTLIILPAVTTHFA